MHIGYLKAAFVPLWIVMLAVVGYAGGTTSLAGWTILGMMALTAPLVMVRFRRLPAPSMSQSIHGVLRRPEGRFGGELR